MATRAIIATMARAIVRTLSAPEWVSTLDAEERAWLLLLAICEAIHPLGAVSVPSRDELIRIATRIDRDAQIWTEFDGRNYAELAVRHGLTTRQVRRIVERERRERSRQ